MKPLDRLYYGSARSRGSRRRKVTRWPLSPSAGRLRVLLILIAVIFSMAAGRALQIQAIDAEAYASAAADQITVARPIPAFRGEISDRNGEILAYTEATVTVISDPEMIRTNGKFAERMTARDVEVASTAAERIAQLLAVYAGGEVDTYLPLLTKEGSRYSVVARQVSAASYSRLSQAMDTAGLIGLYRESAPTRRYPSGTLAANVIGFVNAEGVGSAGLEQTLNSTLSGKSGREVYETSPNGKIPLGTSVLTPAQNGLDYQLTLDSGLQWQVEQILADRVRMTEAKSGMALVMNVKTGEVLTLANYPSFDPNKYGTYELADMGNRVVTDAYTPGSVQKVLTFAAMIDTGVVSSSDIVEVPTRVKSGDHWVGDADTHPTQEMLARGILAKSSNVGTILLARKMSKATLQSYVTAFGLGRKTGIGLPGEAKGSVPGPDMADYTRDGLAFGGSGVTVTALQEAAAVAGIANGGIYNPPTILKSRTLADGTVEEIKRGEPRRVVSEETSREVVSMMETMVAQNQLGVFTVDGYRTGAKTGTSKKFVSSCNCFRGLVTSTIGVGPVEDPQILVYVVVDDPKRGSSGMGVAGPAYQDMMSLALARYAVEPSAKKSPKLPIFP